MKKLYLLIAVFIFSTSNLFSQKIPERALENPLDCALYLYFQDKDAIDLDKLTQAFFEVNRFDDLIRIIDSADNNYTKINLLDVYSTSLLIKKQPQIADQFLLKAIAIINTADESNSLDISSISSIAAKLVTSSRSAEVPRIIIKQTEDSDKLRILLAVIESLRRAGLNQKMLKFLSEALELAEKTGDADDLIRIADAYVKINQNNQALAVLSRLEQNLTSKSEEEQRENFLQMIPVYLQFGQTKTALSLWQKYNDPDEDDELYYFSVALLDYTNLEIASPYLTQLRQNSKFTQRDGYKLVEIYLKRNDIETATLIAKQLSNENDNYSQQKAFILLADKLIEAGRDRAALEILDFAFQRARKIVYVHHPEDSVGVSSGSRKLIYLGQIYQRLIRLKQFTAAFKIFSAVNSNELIAREFLAQKLVNFAGQRDAFLSPQKVDKLFIRAQNLVKNQDYSPIDLKLKIADFYAQRKNQSKALKLLTEVIKEGKESCCYEDDFLLEAGKVFEENRLRADLNLRKTLAEFISGE